jgi:hypothetical protein
VWTNPPGFDKNRRAIFGRRGPAASNLTLSANYARAPVQLARINCSSAVIRRARRAFSAGSGRGDSIF